MKKKTKLNKLLREPSTYAGLAGVLIAAFGLEALSPEQLGTILASIAAIFLPENGKK